jgi:hypothetical protein
MKAVVQLISTFLLTYTAMPIPLDTPVIRVEQAAGVPIPGLGCPRVFKSTKFFRKNSPSPIRYTTNVPEWWPVDSMRVGDEV